MKEGINMEGKNERKKWPKKKNIYLLLYLELERKHSKNKEGGKKGGRAGGREVRVVGNR